jgi:hypothetical protein
MSYLASAVSSTENRPCILKVTSTLTMKPIPAAVGANVRATQTAEPKTIFSCIVVLLLSGVQATPVQVKVESHLLGETAEQFFSESKEGVMLNGCTTKDFGKVNRTVKKTAKEYCASLSNIRQRMVGGESGDYKDELSTDETKATTYVFAAGKFVAAEILFIAPDMENNNQGKSFAEILSGLKGTYGPPTSETVLPYHTVYGVQFERHQALWLTASYAIQLDEQPGAHGWTKVFISTRDVYEKKKTESVKPPPNPLN